MTLVENATVIAAMIAFFTFVLSKIFDYAAKNKEYRDNRRAAIVRFQVDIRLRDDNLRAKREAFSDPAYQARMIDLINGHAARGRTFRFYGVAVTDNTVQDEVGTYLATFPASLQTLVRRVILLDKQMIAEYEMMQTSAFEILVPERQIAAFQQWIQSVDDLVEGLQALMPYLDDMVGDRTLRDRRRDALMKRLLTQKSEAK